MENLFIIIISGIFVNNFVLARTLGLCPFLGVSKRTKTAVGMGLAVTFVMTLASLITWLVYKLLVKFDVVYLQTIAFILVIAAFVQFVELFMRKKMPALYYALGIYLPLITTNCVVLGVALLNITKNYSFIGSIVNGFAGGLGYILSLILMSSIRERLELADVPHALRGVPIALITTALMAIAFLGFNGMIK